MIMRHFTRSLLIALTLLLSSTVSAHAQSWPNEPSGSTLLTDWPWNAVVGGGWDQSGGAYISSDSSAPLSPSNVLTFQFPAGYQAGGSPSIVAYSLGNRSGGVYVAFWWKASAGWQQESNSNVSKIAFWWPPEGKGTHFMAMYGPQGSYHLQIELEYPLVCNGHLANSWGDSCNGTRNIDGNTTIVPGNWYRIETFTKPSSTSSSRDGIVQWWVNGVLDGSWADVNFPFTTWSEFQLSPVWGGLNNTKIQTDYYYYDHIRISSGGSSTGGGGGGGPKTDTTPPGVPMGLRAQ